MTRRTLLKLLGLAPLAGVFGWKATANKRVVAIGRRGVYTQAFFSSNDARSWWREISQILADAPGEYNASLFSLEWLDEDGHTLGWWREPFKRNVKAPDMIICRGDIYDTLEREAEFRLGRPVITKEMASRMNCPWPAWSEA